MLVRRLLLTLVASATVVVAGWSLIRTVHSFYRLDFPVRWVESGIVVDEVPPGSSAATAGLETNDTIVAVDGMEVGRLEDPTFLLAGGEQHQLAVKTPEGEPREVLFRPPPPVIEPIYLARTSVGLLGLLCALVVVWKTTRREAAVLLLIAAASLILGAVPNRIAATHGNLQILHRMASAVLPFLIARFFIVFPERRTSVWILDLVTVVAAVGAAATALAPNAEGWWPVVTTLLRVAFSLALAGGITLHVVRWWQASRDARIRRQIEWAALGLFVGLVPWTTLVWLPRQL